MSSAPTADRITLRSFRALQIGQSISLFGTRTARFTLGAWIYEQTGSVTNFALVAFFEALPLFLLSPFSGVCADRFDRRKLMIAAECVAALSLLVVIALIQLGRFQPWHIYAGIAASATASAVRFPALMASISLMVPKEHLGRANGVIALGDGLAQLLAPVAGAGILAAWGIEGALVLDLGTFTVALLPLLRIRIPSAPRAADAPPPSGLWAEIRVALQYIFARPGLLGLAWFTVASSYVHGAVDILVPPLLMELASVSVMGVVLTVAGLGALAGSLLASAWGGGERKLAGVIGFGLLFAVTLIVAGLRPSVFVVAGGGFLVMFSVPLMVSFNTAVWQAKAPPYLQGRTFAARRMAGEAAALIAISVTGPLTDRILKPWVVEGGPLAPWADRLLGDGEGKEISVCLILIGTVFVLALLLPMASRKIRRVEADLPDWSCAPDLPRVVVTP